MELTYDHPGIAAVALLRIAAEESEGPGLLTARMRNLVCDLAHRNGPDAPAELSIALARQYFIVLDAMADAMNVPSEALLAATELSQLDRLRDG